MATIPTKQARGHPRILRGALLAVALVGLGTLAAACGVVRPADPGVASVGKATTTTSAASSSSNGAGGNDYADALKFSRCMRSHGVTNYPDPTASGGFQTIINKNHGSVNGQSVDVNSPQFNSAQKACQHLLPNGGKPTQAQQQQMLANALKYSKCMRAHGEPNFPDPKVGPRGGVGLQIRRGSGVDPNSPQFQAAQKHCQSLLPGRGKAQAAAP